MRVTDLTKHHAVTKSINQSSAEVSTLQENMSSGRRINRLSDDPIGATQAQDFRTKLSFFDNVRRNIQNHYILMDRYENELGDMGDLLRTAKTLILAQANGNADQDTREVTAEELQAITDALVQSGNSKIGKLYIFSGTETLTKSLEQTEPLQMAEINDQDVDHLGGLAMDAIIGGAIGAAAGVVPPVSSVVDPVTGAIVGTTAGIAWNLLTRDSYAAEFDGHSRNEYVLRITKEGPFGRAHYQVSDDAGETWSRDKTLLRVNRVLNEDGAPDDRVVLRFREPQEDVFGAPIMFPEGLEFRFASNPPVIYQGNEVKKMVPTGEGTLLPVNVTAQEIFFQNPNDPDSLNVFDLMFTLQRALLEDDQRVLEARIDDLDDAFNQVVKRRADAGTIRRELENQFRKAGDREFTKTKQLAEVEDLDLQEAVMDLNLAELRNQAALNTGARLIQPSLVNFLR